MIRFQGRNKLVAPLNSCHSNIFTYHKNGMLAAFGVDQATECITLWGGQHLFATILELEVNKKRNEKSPS